MRHGFWLGMSVCILAAVPCTSTVRAQVPGACLLQVGVPAVVKNFQEGVSGGAFGSTLACEITDNGGAGTVTEGTTMIVGMGRNGLVSFENFIGSDPLQVQQLQQISNGRVTLWVTGVSGGTSVTLKLTPIQALAGTPPWKEPNGVVTAGSGVGATWTQRDDRTGLVENWMTPGGDGILTLGGSATVTLTGAFPRAVNINVTNAVRSFLQGESNHGFIVTGSTDTGGTVSIATERFGTANRRPLLRVTECVNFLTGNKAPLVEDLGAAVPEGSSHFIELPLLDGDGETVNYALRSVPSVGETTLAGNQLAYRTPVGILGRQTIEYYAYDSVASSRLATVTIIVTADGTLSTLALQDTGVGPAVTRATTFPAGLVDLIGPQLTIEDSTRIGVQKEAFRSVLDFPTLFGSGANQIPVGSEIVSASLELFVNSATGDAVVTAQRISNPYGLATWYEPPVPGSLVDSGVSMLYRDARQGVREPWETAGGDGALDGAGSVMVDAATALVVKAIDVTAAVQAWSSGIGPNHGWILSSSDAYVEFASDEAVTVTERPRLVIAYRAPGGVTDEPPVANGGGDQSVLAANEVTLDGSGSYDPEGATLTFAWAQIGGPSVTTSSPTPAVLKFTAPASVNDENYVFRLTVTTSPGLVSDLDVVSVFVPGTVGPGDSYPTANAGADLALSYGTMATLDASASSDPEGPLIETYWSQLSGPAVEISNPRSVMQNLFFIPYMAPNTSVTLVFQLAVLDAAFQWDTDTVQVVVTRGANIAPTANAGGNQTVTAGDWVGFDFRQTLNPDFDPLTYTLTGAPAGLRLNGTPVPYFQTASFSGPIGLVMPLQLTVTDPWGGSSTDSFNLFVTGEPVDFTGNSLSLAPYTQALSLAEAVHLEKRVSFRGQRAAEFKNLGLNATVNLLMNATTNPQILIDAAAATAVIDDCPGLAPRAASHQIAQEYLYHIMIHDVDNPLRWKLFYFWHDRLATATRALGADKRQRWPLKHMFLIADNVLTTDYRQFLKDFTVDEAELWWLNGAQNQYMPPPALANENYAREFWELFVLGENSGAYTELEIKAAARAFTGWNYTNGVVDCNGFPYDTSMFYPGNHDTGMKTIFNQTGNWNAFDVVDLTLNFRGQEAADHLTTALFEHLVKFSPTPAQVSQLSSILITNNWNVRPVVETILKSEAMFSPEARSARVSNPLEVVMGFLRVTGLPVTGSPNIRLVDVRQELENLSLTPLNPPAVNGWPEGAEWVNQAAVLGRGASINRFLETFKNTGVDLSAVSPGSPNRNDAATWLMNLARIMGIDKSELNPALFDAWVYYLNQESDTKVDYFDLSDPDHQRVKALGSLWQAFSLSIDQAK